MRYPNILPDMGDLSDTVKPDRLTSRLAQCFRDLRHKAGWSLDELTDRCGVSRATLSRLEHAEVSPTANALSRIARAYDIPPSRLLRMAEAAAPDLVARDDQPLVMDPATGAEQRQVSAPDEGYASRLSEGSLPQDAERALSGAEGGEAHLVLLDGRMSVTLHEARFELRKGDRLRFLLDGRAVLRGLGKRGARYFLVIT